MYGFEPQPRDFNASGSDMGMKENTSLKQQRLAPSPPFVWPEPREIESPGSYRDQPPIAGFGVESTSIFGVVSAPTTRGIAVLDSWLNNNASLKVSLVVAVYPTCASQKSDLTSLLEMISKFSDRLSVHILPLDDLRSRATNALCFLQMSSDATWMTTGASEDFGLGPWTPGEVNFVYRADPALAEAFKKYFDYTWGSTRPLSDEGVALIPELVVPDGTDEATKMWMDFIQTCSPDKTEESTVEVNPKTGDVTLFDANGNKITPPSEQLGLKKLDLLEEWVARLYGQGRLVSIDKLSRMPPLDAPIDPRLFGDAAEFHTDNVTRKVSMRVSVIDETSLKEINKKRTALRTLLGRFSYSLGDNMAWMPSAAIELFNREVSAANAVGHELIAKLLNGDVDSFIEGKRQALVQDINRAFKELGKQGQAPDHAVKTILDSLRERLRKAQTANFMPTLSYSSITFLRSCDEFSNPWGQAYSLISDIATFPRQAAVDPFFFRGINTDETSLLESMNVADDAILREPQRDHKQRCKGGLEFIKRVGNSQLSARDRCDLLVKLIGGQSVDSLSQEFAKLGADI